MIKHVPFADWSEWLFLYSSFFDETKDGFNQIKEALAIVETWKLRGTKIPSAVEITAQIIEIFSTMESIKAGKSSGNFSGFGDDIWRLSLSSAVIRGVNSICDELQDEAYAQSIAVLAVKAGLPRWLVDVRHDATHGVLPSKDCLTLAAKALLKYYRDNYWETQAKSLLNSQISRGTCAEELQRCRSLSGKEKNQEIDDIVDKLCNEISSKSFPQLIVPELLTCFAMDPEADQHHDKWERVLAGFNDAWPTFTGALVDALCDAIIKQNENSNIYIFWVEYLLSRRWHSLSDPGLAQINPDRSLLNIAPSKWKKEEKKFMNEAAPPKTQKGLRLEIWLRKALLDPHQWSQKLLGALIPAIYEKTLPIFQRITKTISLFYGSEKTMAGDGLELCLDEMEAKIRSITGEHKETESVKVPTCSLNDASTCDQWTLVRDFEGIQNGSMPVNHSLIGILEKMSEVYENALKTNDSDISLGKRSRESFENTKLLVDDQNSTIAKQDSIKVRLIV